MPRNLIINNIWTSLWWWPAHFILSSGEVVQQSARTQKQQQQYRSKEWKEISLIFSLQTIYWRILLMTTIVLKTAFLLPVYKTGSKKAAYYNKSTNWPSIETWITKIKATAITVGILLQFIMIWSCRRIKWVVFSKTG